MKKMKKPTNLICICVAILTGFSIFGRAQSPGNLKHFPEGASPLEVGQLVAEHFIETPHTNFGRPVPPKAITYPETCTWYGALRFAEATHNIFLLQRLADRFDPLFGKDSALIPKPDHVDYSVFGSVPLELFIQTRDSSYLPIGKIMADNQWAVPSGPRVTAASRAYYEKGLSWQTRLWVDDMFMITTLQTEAYRATGDQSYLDHAAKEAVTYLDSLQEPNGLFYHAPDVPFFWGRGDGWFAVGMTELLQLLPRKHPARKRIMQGFQNMMASLRKYQDANGMWHQLIDDPNAWPEMSCTGMFTFAMITGVKQGWLPKKTYGPVARKGWLGMIRYINPNGDTREVCEGTNKKNDHQYYLNRKRNTGDLHGQAPVLWCATALLRP